MNPYHQFVKDAMDTLYWDVNPLIGGTRISCYNQDGFTAMRAIPFVLPDTIVNFESVGLKIPDEVMKEAFLNEIGALYGPSGEISDETLRAQTLEKLDRLKERVEAGNVRMEDVLVVTREEVAPVINESRAEYADEDALLDIFDAHNYVVLEAGNKDDTLVFNFSTGKPGYQDEYENWQEYLEKTWTLASIPSRKENFLRDFKKLMKEVCPRLKLPAEAPKMRM